LQFTLGADSRLAWNTSRNLEHSHRCLSP
jgi:hypothetical protein